MFFIKLIISWSDWSVGSNRSSVSYTFAYCLSVLYLGTCIIRQCTTVVWSNLIVYPTSVTEYPYLVDSKVAIEWRTLTVAPLLDLSFLISIPNSFLACSHSLVYSSMTHSF